MEESGPFDFNRAVEKTLHYLNLDRFDLAEKEARGAITQAPGVSGLHVLLAEVLVQAERHDEAEDVAQTALSLDPLSDEALCVLGRIEIQRGKHRRAEEYFLEALKIDPENSASLSQYGYLLLKTSKLDKAEKVFRRCLEIDPDNEAYHSFLSTTLSSKRKLDDSTRAAKEGVRLNPDGSYPQLAAGQAALASGRPFVARRHFRESLRIDASSSSAREMFEAADQYCRWCCLPYYYYSLATDRIPGAQFTIWGCFVVFYFVGKSMFPGPVILTIGALYFLFCLYTWVAMPITKAWVRLRPAR